MPGDADESGAKARAEQSKKKSAADEMRAAVARKVGDKDEKKDHKKFDGPSAKDAADRGIQTPAQVEGDGWDDLPAQMRG